MPVLQQNQDFPNRDNALYWLTGFAGAGKTTIGKALAEELKKRGSGNVIFLDGDMMRWAFDGMFGYSPEDRKKLALSYPRLCKLLVEQGFVVVFATISMFNEVREWNRKMIKNYFEVYLKVSPDILRARDQKGLHSKGVSDMVGFDFKLEEPQNSDLIIENNGNISVEECVKMILEK